MVTCRTCKYFQPDSYWYSKEMRLHNALCRHPKAQTVNLVSGKVTYEKAQNMRYPGNVDKNNTACGLKALYYEEEKNPIVLTCREFTLNDIMSFILFTMITFFILAIMIVVSRKPVV
jgi:hypothetical protein